MAKVNKQSSNGEAQQETEEVKTDEAAGIVTSANSPKVVTPINTQIDTAQLAYQNYVERIRKKSEDLIQKVIITVPKAFKVTFESGVILHIPEGVHKIEKFVADHWYSKANGVQIFDDKKE